MGDYTCFMCQWQDNDSDNFVVVTRHNYEIRQPDDELAHVCVACYDEFGELGQ